MAKTNSTIAADKRLENAIDALDFGRGRLVFRPYAPPLRDHLQPSGRCNPRTCSNAARTVARGGGDGGKRADGICLIAPKKITAKKKFYNQQKNHNERAKNRQTNK